MLSQRHKVHPNNEYKLPKTNDKAAPSQKDFLICNSHVGSLFKDPRVLQGDVTPVTPKYLSRYLHQHAPLPYRTMLLPKLIANFAIGSVVP